MSILRYNHFSQTQQIPIYTKPANSLSQTQKISFHKPIISLLKFVKNPKQIQQTQDWLQIQPRERERGFTFNLIWALDLPGNPHTAHYVHTAKKIEPPPANTANATLLCH